MKFSVLMSVYKQEKPAYLQQAIDSVVNQTLPPSQIVIVKDGPLTKELDAVIDLCVKKNPCFTIVTLKKNSGLGVALNNGLKACKYNIVARMDTDDISVPERFEKQIAYISKHRNLAIIGSNIQEYNEDMSTKLSARKVPKDTADILKYAKNRNPFNHMSVVYKKDAVLKAGGYLHCPYFEGYYLWIRMLKQDGQFHNIQELLVNVRAGQSMTDRRGGIGYVSCIINFQRKALKLKYVNLPTMLYNIVIRSVISVAPSNFRKYLYNKKLRERS